MTPEKIRTKIRSTYKSIPDHLDNFVPRRGQNYLIAQIADTLLGKFDSKQRILVAEAGTGIGKSLSYLMAAVPIGYHQQRKVVVSTATVALQEQLITKDLPLYKRLSGIDFQFRLAKGRSRYCCLQKLSAFAQSELNLDGESEISNERRVLGELYQAYMSGKWDGDRDNWPQVIEQSLWQQVESDKHSCNASIPLHRQCPLHQARLELESADVIVANHSLVIADLELGGGILLPEPDKAIFIFDEAHHLPHVARDQSAGFIGLSSTIIWLERLNISIKGTLTNSKVNDSRTLDEMLTGMQQLIPAMRTLLLSLKSLPFNESIFRFAHAELPDEMLETIKEVKQLSQKSGKALSKLTDSVTEKYREGAIVGKSAQSILSELGYHLQRLEHIQQLSSLITYKREAYMAPIAVWVEHQEAEHEFLLHASPLEIGWKLDQMLWSRCHGAVLVSATLRALSSFNYFSRQVGLSQNEDSAVQYLAISSPFDYQRQAELVVVRTGIDPSETKFTEYLSKNIKKYIQPNKANLVLFASYWQMNEVKEKLALEVKKHKWSLQVQGEKSRQAILDTHQAIVKLGGTSILFGTGSFSEGLDLPGNLLENVIITKIPFAVPTSPVEQAYSEYIRDKGGNPFMQTAVPEASKKLIQSVGRLLRKEQDSGRVVILDQRLITKRYGAALLDSLPPFKRVFL